MNPPRRIGFKPSTSINAVPQILNILMTRGNAISLTPRFSGVGCDAQEIEPLQRFSQARQTAEAVHASPPASNTPLKQGVNERSPNTSASKGGFSSASPILIETLLLAVLTGLMGCKSDRCQIDSETHRAKNTMEINTWDWASYTRPDGSKGFWNPKPVIAMGGTLVNVIYIAEDRPDRPVYGALLPPKLMAEVMSNCQPELKECHAHGIKVIGYANTIWFHPEMMKREGWDSSDLSAIDTHGKPVINSMWEKRGTYMSCVSNPKWLKLQQWMVQETADAGFDGLQFDLNPYAVPPGYNCRCHYCEEKWSAYSKKIFGVEKPMPGKDAPDSDPSKLDFNKPEDRIYREWRHKELADFLNSITKRVRRTHPEFLLSFNHAAGDPNFAYLSLKDALKIPSSELWHLKLAEDSSLYAYRLTEALSGEKCIGLVNSEDQIKPTYRFHVGVAESFAGGGSFYFGPRSKPAFEYSNYLRENQDAYVGTSSEAMVGVLYSWRDQNFVQSAAPNSGSDPFRHAAALLARQCVPYDAVIVEKGLKAKELAKYRVIVAPQLHLLGDRDSKALEAYVRAGGHLLSIGPLGTLREVKTQYVNRQPPPLTAWTSKECSQAWQAQLGSGKVAYVPVAWSGKSESAMVVTPEFAQAADYLALYSQLRLKAATALEATVRGKGNRRSIHIMRFGPVDNLTDPSVHVDYQTPKGCQVTSATVISPEFPAKELTTWKESNGRFQADLNQPGSYALISIKLKGM
jgi:hypothetical protein